MSGGPGREHGWGHSGKVHGAVLFLSLYSFFGSLASLMTLLLTSISSAPDLPPLLLGNPYDEELPRIGYHGIDIPLDAVHFCYCAWAVFLLSPFCTTHLLCGCCLRFAKRGK